jgi:hypothetical protein
VVGLARSTAWKYRGLFELIRYEFGVVGGQESHMLNTIALAIMLAIVLENMRFARGDRLIK